MAPNGPVTRCQGRLVCVSVSAKVAQAFAKLLCLLRPLFQQPTARLDALGHEELLRALGSVTLWATSLSHTGRSLSSFFQAPQRLNIHEPRPLHPSRGQPGRLVPVDAHWLQAAFDQANFDFLSFEPRVPEL